MTERTYEYLEHAADVKFRAFGSNHEEAFRNAGYALTDILVDRAELSDKESRTITAQGHTYEQILYDYLEKLIILIDTEQFLLSHVDSLLITRDHDILKVQATLRGDLNSALLTEQSDTKQMKYQTHGDVKAITYHEMSITKDEEGLIVIEAVVDV